MNTFSVKKYFSGAEAKEFFERSKLPITELRKIWQLSDVSQVRKNILLFIQLCPHSVESSCFESCGQPEAIFFIVPPRHSRQFLTLLYKVNGLLGHSNLHDWEANQEG